MNELRKVLGLMLMSLVVGLLVLYVKPDYTEPVNLHSNRSYYPDAGTLDAHPRP